MPGLRFYRAIGPYFIVPPVGDLAHIRSGVRVVLSFLDIVVFSRRYAFVTT